MGGESAAPELFVIATGQDDNVGDVVLRREYLDRLREIGRLHLLLAATPDFVDSLQLHDSDVVYASFRQWYLTACRALVRGRVWFVDKPGQLQLDRNTVRRQVRFLPLIMGIRIRHGQVLRIGMAMQSADPRYARYLQPLFRLSTQLRWRDTATRSAFGFGEVGPDLAFGWRKTATAELDAERTNIVVTYRGDRDLPSDQILDAIAKLTADGERRVVVVTQVRRDAERSAQLATRLGAEHVAWPADRTLADHEAVLRRVYRESALVISDRLHALIIGMTEGAAPLCLTDSGEEKVERHLDAMGFSGSTLCVADASAPLASHISHQLGRRAEALAATKTALTGLDDLMAELAALAVTRP